MALLRLKCGMPGVPWLGACQTRTNNGLTDNDFSGFCKLVMEAGHPPPAFLMEHPEEPANTLCHPSNKPTDWNGL